MTLPGMRWRVGAVGIATLTALSLAGCSSSGGTPAGDAGTSGGAASSTGTPTDAATGGGATTADAATTAAVKSAYAKFFSPTTPENVSLGLLQNGQAFKATIEKQAQGSMASSASVKVASVSLLSPDTAKVAFTIYVNKQAMLKNQPGYAVKTNGTWQVSEYTFCGLLTLEGSAPAECKQPAATAPPK